MSNKRNKSEGGPFVLQIRLRRDDILSFDTYPFSLPIIRSLNILTLDSKVTIFVGENGSGKSTLLEAIAVAAGLNPEGGSRNFHFTTRSSHSPLAEYLTLVRTARRPVTDFFLRAESFFNVATEIENIERDNPGLLAHYGGRSLHEQSHGESFLALFLHRFQENGFYILDEPEAALSPTRQLALLRRMHHLAENGSQFLVATHSPILLAYPNAKIYSIGEEGIQSVTYDQTEHFLVTRQFLNNPEGMLRTLLE